MKSFLKILFFTFAICLSSCQHVVQYPAELLIADSLCSSNPDSAMVYLEGLSVDIPNYREPAQRYYQLLTIKAQDKAFISHTSDSLILDVVSYYEDGGDPGLLPEAYYYAGRVMRDLGDAPQALDYFQKGLEIIHANNKMQNNELCDTKKLELVLYLQTGYLFNSQQLHDKAIESFKKAYDVSKLLSDSTTMIIALSDLGQSYEAEENKEEALRYFSIAEQLAEEAGDSIHLNIIFCHEALVLTQMDREIEAQDKLSLVSELKISKPLLSKYYLANAYLHSKTGHIDSAQYYYNKLSVFENVGVRKHAILWFANLAVKQKHPDEAIEYLRQYIVETNEVSKSNNAEATALAHSLYNYQLREKENNRLKLRNANFQICLTISISSVILLIAVILFIIKIQSQFKEKTQQQFIQQQLQQRQRELESEQTIKNKTLRIQELEARIITTNSEKYIVQQELEALKLSAQHAELGKQRIQIFKQLLEVSSISVLINNRELENKILSVEDWKEIEDFFKANNPEFISSLLSLHTFTTIEWRVTLLVKLGLNPKSIGSLIPTSQSSVSSIRRRLYEKIFKQKGNSSDWDDFILNL